LTTPRDDVSPTPENRLLKRLIDKTRSLLGAEDAPDGTAEGTAAEAATDTPRTSRAKQPASAGKKRSAAGKTTGRTAGKKKPAATGNGKGGKKKAPAARRKPANVVSSDLAGTAGAGDTPRIVPREEHPVSRRSMGRSALKVLDRLHEGGFGAYLVGGGVRDALVGIDPKDFDIATDASPEEIRALFRNSRIIGRRFRLVHVVFGREIIEVATFRAAHDQGEGGEVGASGRIVRDNVFGSIAEDARRRDFSVNALYYNIADRSIVDYVGGLEDIESRVFRLIGDPLTRCEEDPVRVLRAVRLSAKLGFTIEKTTGAAMKQVAPELRHTPPARLFEEVLKLFQGGYAERSFAAVIEHDLLRYLFPLLQRRLADGDEELRTMLDAALANTDRRVAQGKPITPSYLLAFMLWPDVESQARADCEAGVPVHEALREAADSVLGLQLKVISIPRRFSGPMKEIWQMQPRLERNRGRRALSMMEDRRFRAAYDFLCLRAGVDERLAESARWWTDIQEMPEDERDAAAASRAVASGIWGDGAAGEAVELPPVVSEEERPRGDGARKRRRGGRRRGGGGESGGGESGGERAEVAPGDAAGSDTSDRPAAARPAGVGASDGSAVGGNAADGGPKKKRRRRRRKPAGERTAPSGDA